MGQGKRQGGTPPCALKVQMLVPSMCLRAGRSSATCPKKSGATLARHPLQSTFKLDVMASFGRDGRLTLWEAIGSLSKDNLICCAARNAVASQSASPLRRIFSPRRYAALIPAPLASQHFALPVPCREYSNTLPLKIE